MMIISQISVLFDTIKDPFRQDPLPWTFSRAWASGSVCALVLLSGTAPIHNPGYVVLPRTGLLPYGIVLFVMQALGPVLSLGTLRSFQVSTFGTVFKAVAIALMVQSVQDLVHGSRVNGPCRTRELAGVAVSVGGYAAAVHGVDG